MKKFDFIYFGLVALAISFALYAGVDLASATPEKFDYVIYLQSGNTIALNTNTNNIDFNSTNS